MKRCRCGHNKEQHFPDGKFQYPNGSWDFLYLKCGSCNECQDYVEEQEDED